MKKRLFNDLYPKGTLEEFPVEKLAVLSGVTGASSSPRQKTVRPSTFWDEDVGADILLRISEEFEKSIEWLLTGKEWI